MWAHKTLDVYRKALDAAVELDGYSKSIPRGRADLRDELRRASTSMLLNAVEGANEFAPDEKARFYRMARRSAAESAAILDLCARIFRPPIPAERAQVLLDDVGAMLTVMIEKQARRSTTARARSPPSASAPASAFASEELNSSPEEKA